MSSPHLRGCFQAIGEIREIRREFPASAGVFLELQTCYLYDEGVPRICGGVSRHRPIFPDVLWSSPHLRGCFHLGGVNVRHRLEFPASAGVFLTPETPSSVTTRVPRICGGVSDARSVRPRHSVEFPAFAGVFPRFCRAGKRTSRVPRICGGVSAIYDAVTDDERSSPHLRGCFRRLNTNDAVVSEFPASAGVFLSSP